MKKLLLFLLTFVIANCNSQSDKSLDKLKNCLIDNDLIGLNEAIIVFEKKLSEKYVGQNIAKAYLSYLTDINLMNIRPEFFQAKDSKQIIENLRESGTFFKIWVLPMSSESLLIDTEGIMIDSDTDSNAQNSKRINLVELNPIGEYQKCLLEKLENRDLKDYLNLQKEIPRISSGLTSKTLLTNMTESDFKNELNRLVITMGFYYEMVILFETK